MRYVITLLLLVIGLTSYSQGKFTRMGQQYFYLKTQKFGDTLLLDTAMFGTANMNNPNLFMKIDTTGMSVSGSVKVVLDTVPSSGEDARVDSINAVLQDNEVVGRTLFAIQEDCGTAVFDKNYFVATGINPCDGSGIAISTSSAVVGNTSKILHNASSAPEVTGVTNIIEIGSYVNDVNNIIEITLISEDTAIVIYHN
jgi:hypothetical protein